MLYYNAFWSLDRERPGGFSEGAIPRRAITEYAADFDFDEDQTELLHYVIREMDNEKAEWRQKQHEAEKLSKRN